MAFDTSTYLESPYLKGSELEEGEKTILTISQAYETTFPQSGDTVPVLEFLEVQKKLTLNKSRVAKLVEILGEDTDEWIGHQIAVYSVPVQYQGKTTQGIAIAAATKKKPKLFGDKPKANPVPADVSFMASDEEDDK